MSIRSTLHRDRFISLRGHIRVSFDRETMRAIANIGSSTLAEQLFLRIGFLTYSIIAVSYTHLSHVEQEGDEDGNVERPVSEKECAEKDDNHG